MPEPKWKQDACEGCREGLDVFSFGDGLPLRHDDDTAGSPLCTAPTEAQHIEQLTARVAELEALLNTPETECFDKATPLEAAHQVVRWGNSHDSGKNPEDWFWLIGYLAGKALASQKAGNLEKAKHHCISTAAALRNWHAHIRSGETFMRPGITEPAPSTASAPAPQSDSIRKALAFDWLMTGAAKHVNTRAFDKPKYVVCEMPSTRPVGPGSNSSPLDAVEAAIAGDRTVNLYYIQNKGYVGNCLLWWKNGGSGYTCDLAEAWQVTEEKAKHICASRPDEDIPHSVDFVNSVAARHVSCEQFRAALEAKR